MQYQEERNFVQELQSILWAGFLADVEKRVSLPLQPKDKVGKDSTFPCPNALWGPWRFRCNFGPNSESGFELSDIILVDEAFDIKDDAEITP
jgi:hypothetical protein